MSIRLFKDTFNYGLGQILPKIIGFLLIPVYTAYLSPEEYGVVELSLTTAAFFAVTMRMSIPGAITRFYFDFKTQREQQQYISTIYWSVLVIGFIFFTIFSLIGLFWIDELIPGLPFWPFFCIIVLASFLNVNSDVQRRLLQVRGQSAYNAILNIFVALAGIGFAVILVVFFELGSLGLVLSSLITAIIFFVQAQLYLRRDLLLFYKKDFFKDSFFYSIYLFPTHFLGAFAPLFAKSILSASVSLSAVGLFAIANKLVQPLNILINALTTALTPIYYSYRTKLDKVEFENKIQNIYSKIWLVTILLVSFIFIFSKPILNFFASEAYREADVCMKILAFGSIPSMAYILMSQEIFFRKETRRIMIINLTSLFFNFIFAFLLVEKWEENGIALSLALQQIITMIFTYRFIRKGSFKIIDTKFFVTTTLFVCVCLFAWTFVESVSPSYFLVYCISAFLFITLGLAWIAKGTCIEMINIVKNYLKK